MKNKYIIDMCLTLLAQARMPFEFCVEEFNSFVNLINWLLSQGLKYVSPYEKLNHRVPNYLTLQVFRRSYFPYLRPYNKNKMEFRSKHCIFLGYSLNNQGYHYLDIETSRVYLSCHVVFNESLFPLKAGFCTLIFTKVTNFVSPMVMPSKQPQPMTSSQTSPQPTTLSFNDNISNSIALGLTRGVNLDRRPKPSTGPA